MSYNISMSLGTMGFFLCKTSNISTYTN